MSHQVKHKPLCQMINLRELENEKKKTTQHQLRQKKLLKKQENEELNCTIKVDY